MLITIQSRCQIIRFQSNQEDTVNGLLKEKGASNATAQLVSQLTNSADQALLLLESESFGQIRQESWNWFVRIFTNRAMAFITIQSQVLPLLVSKVESEQFLTLLQLYIRDALLCAQGLERQLIQSDKIATVKTIAGKLSVKQWIQEHEKMTKALSKIQSNVGVQAVLEQWVLQIP